MRKGQAEGKREATRLAAIERLGAARREVNGVLQGLVDDARAAFSTELCMVNLVLADVQYFRAWSGELPEDLARARQDPRERSMCRYVVENEAPFVVEDFLATEEFREQYFRVKYGVRFYAGAPLVTSDGHVLGSLCLIDTRPREFGEGGLAELQALARAVVARLETLGALQRERAAREEEARRGRELERLARQQERILVSAGEGIVGLDPGGKIGFANPAAAAMLGYETGEMVGRNMHHLVHHTRPDGTPYPLEECPNYLAFREGDTRRTDGEVFWRRDGTAFPVEYASSPVIEGGDVRGAVVTFSDVRERKVAEEALKESEERFRTLTDAALEALVISERGRILEVNRAFTEIFGYEPSEIVGADSLACIAPESREPVRENLLSGHDRPYEAVGLRKNGERFEAEIRGKASAYRGRAVRITAVRDITERKRAEEALKRSEERFRSLVQNASDLITVLEADGTVLYESPALEPMLGYAPEDFVGRNNYDLIHPDDAPRVLRAFARLSEERGANPYVEYRFRHADGSWRHLESGGVNLLDEPGVGGIVVNTRDITERKTLEERLLHQALHDPLTGLANRALLLDRLGHALDRAERTEACVAALFLDLDDFKVVNDSLGHDAGDELLVEAAERLGSCLRPEDTIARLGGDEFVVLLEDVHGRGEATEAATRIAEALREPFLLGAHEEAFVSVSIGVALASGG
nr:PAS domain S-box protein [Actinomycetota bacterium]